MFVPKRSEGMTEKEESFGRPLLLLGLLPKYLSEKLYSIS